MNTEQIAYTIQTAAEATGLSIDTIRRAVNSGHLVASRPKVSKNGTERDLAKDVILRTELERWLTGRAA